MLSSSEINLWLRTVEPYRESLDLATIIWFWMRLDNTDNWKPIRDEIYLVCRDVVDETKKDFSLTLAQSKGNGSFGGKKISIERTDSEQWMLDYRNAISEVTPFSDYEIYDDEDFASDEWEPSEYYQHHVLSNLELTQCFVDLDLLLDRLSNMGHYYPPQFFLKAPVVNDVDDVGGKEFDKVSANPFRLYCLTPKVEEFLWSGNDRAGSALMKVAPKVSSSEFRLILGAIFGVNQSKANALRIYTQPKHQKMQGTKGEDIKKILRPLMKVLLIEGERSQSFWRLKKKELDGLAEYLNLEFAELTVLLMIAKPDAEIESAEAACFHNPGQAKPEMFMEQLERLVDQYLPSLRNKLTDPQERKYYKKLQDFFDNN